MKIVDIVVMVENRKKVFEIVMVFVIDRKVSVMVLLVSWLMMIFNFMVWVCNCNGKILEVRI